MQNIKIRNQIRLVVHVTGRLNIVWLIQKRFVCNLDVDFDYLLIFRLHWQMYERKIILCNSDDKLPLPKKIIYVGTENHSLLAALVLNKIVCRMKSNPFSRLCLTAYKLVIDFNLITIIWQSINQFHDMVLSTIRYMP